MLFGMVRGRHRMWKKLDATDADRSGERQKNNFLPHAPLLLPFHPLHLVHPLGEEAGSWRKAEKILLSSLFSEDVSTCLWGKNDAAIGWLEESTQGSGTEWRVRARAAKTLLLYGLKLKKEALSSQLLWQNRYRLCLQRWFGGSAELDRIVVVEC